MTTLTLSDVQRVEATAEAMLRDIDPLFAGPCYVICRTPSNRDQLPNEFPKAWAYTGTDLDMECLSYLFDAGRWRGGVNGSNGRGFCTLLNHFMIGGCEPDEAKVYGTVIHEAAHWAEYQLTLAEDHGPVWIRGMLHMSQRCGNWFAARGHRVLSEPVAFSKVASMDLYNRSPMWQYMVTLEDELNCWTTAQNSIVWRLKQRPPAAFQDLCNSDARANGQPLPFPLAGRQAVA